MKRICGMILLLNVFPQIGLLLILFYLLVKNCLFNFLLKNLTIFFHNHFILSILYEFKLLHRVEGWI
ncbi:hypothetical protein C2G38_2103789 [Gigaspora rosea]|uniref:Uncharacterized protein n=1 Tax=Gigaspora rosea TaxID=44941 RepID=A0A397UM77_9GLOM|nr:hypothetical protein C2G38_2103789 [Gigaspora rosea]